MRASAGNRVLMLLENSTYPADARVRMEAIALTERGYEVTVVCPRGRGQRWSEQVQRVQVYRFPAGPKLSGTPGILVEYAFAMAGAVALSLRIAFTRGFDVIHAHSPPDTFVLIGLLYKLLGKRLLFDHHDLSPEMYCARFRRPPGDPIFRLLILLERLSFWAADHVITTNGSYREIAMRRGGVDASKITVVRNGPELDRVRPVPPDEELRRRAPHIIGYVGVLGYQDGVDYLLRSLAILAHEMRRFDFHCVIVGKGDALDELRLLAQELEISSLVSLTGYVPDDVLMRSLSTADICVDPDPYDGFSDKSSMIKMTEYMALGKPIVAFDLTEHRVTAGDAALYARPNDERDFARKLAALMDDPQKRQMMGEHGRRRVLDRFAWFHQEPYLISAYETALRVPGRRRGADDNRAKAPSEIGFDRRA